MKFGRISLAAIAAAALVSAPALAATGLIETENIANTAADTVVVTAPAFGMAANTDPLAAPLGVGADTDISARDGDRDGDVVSL